MRYEINLETMLLDIDYIYRKDIKRRSQLFVFRKSYNTQLSNFFFCFYIDFKVFINNFANFVPKQKICQLFNFLINFMTKQFEEQVIISTIIKKTQVYILVKISAFTSQNNNFPQDSKYQSFINYVAQISNYLIQSKQINQEEKLHQQIQGRIIIEAFQPQIINMSITEPPIEIIVYLATFQRQMAFYFYSSLRYYGRLSFIQFIQLASGTS
ncbi:unnamed protein product [Paramecium pentaurelia]|uniref:Uncharacterized protein n=1 Tax=Paramecium pentaurelia TaxID=43138 RepID=A0A8S1XAD0_9CILI|nr:unnamed protein product [Paramecium pentaurelia]